MKLGSLAKEILQQVDDVLLGRATRRGLYDALTDLATVVAARDGHLLTPSAEPSKLDRVELLRVRKLVGIIARNDLAGKWAPATYDLPDDGDPIEALDARVVARARADFNIFAEYVGTRLVPARDRQLLGRVAPIEQAPIHRRWAQLWDDPRNQRMIVMAHNEAAKTRQLSILRPLFELSRDHNLKIAILTNTASNAQNILRAIADLILSSADFKRVFPSVRPALPWNLPEIQIERDSTDKEPSISAFGVKGAILGARVDLLIVDDVLDGENTSTITQQTELSRWFKANVETRLTEDARCLVVGTPWALGDLLHELEANTEDYKTYRFPIYDEKGESTWPAQWPKTRIEARRRTLREVEFQRCMMVTARADTDALFKEADVNRALQLGADYPRVRVVEDLPGGLPPTAKIFVGVDLATGSQRKRADDSAIAGLISDDADGSLVIIALDSGRWAPSETRRRVVETNEAFHPGAVHVEDNGAQEFFLDEMRRDGLPVVGHTTSGQNKHDAAIGLPGLATAFEQGKVTIPKWIAASPAGKALLHALLYFSKDAHTPDVLMSVWIAFSAARLARRGPRAVKVAAARMIDGSGSKQLHERGTLAALLDVLESPDDEDGQGEADARAAIRDARDAA